MGLGRLEEDLGVAISIEFSSRLGCCCDKIAILLIDFGDRLDCVRLLALEFKDFLLSDRS